MAGPAVWALEKDSRPLCRKPRGTVTVTMQCRHTNVPPLSPLAASRPARESGSTMLTRDTTWSPKLQFRRGRSCSGGEKGREADGRPNKVTQPAKRDVVAFANLNAVAIEIPETRVGLPRAGTSGVVKVVGLGLEQRLLARRAAAAFAAAAFGRSTSGGAASRRTAAPAPPAPL